MIRCPKCFEEVHSVKAYGRFSKRFQKIKNWKYCSKCDGYILTIDCLKRKGMVSFKTSRGWITFPKRKEAKK